MGKALTDRAAKEASYQAAVSNPKAFMGAAAPGPSPQYEAQLQSLRGQLAGVVFGYATQWERPSHPPREQGLGGGVSLGVVFSRPHQPELHVQGALLMVSDVEGGCWSEFPVPGCEPGRVFHPVTALRGALTWPFGSRRAEWSAGFGITAYFPMDDEPIFPNFAAGPDLTISRRGLAGSARLFVEARVSYLKGNASHGGALFLQTGIEF